MGNFLRSVKQQRLEIHIKNLSKCYRSETQWVIFAVGKNNCDSFKNYPLVM